MGFGIDMAVVIVLMTSITAADNVCFEVTPGMGSPEDSSEGSHKTVISVVDAAVGSMMAHLLCFVPIY
jgi:hypothetical protein